MQLRAGAPAEEKGVGVMGEQEKYEQSKHSGATGHESQDVSHTSERMRLGMAALILAMVPLVIVGSLIAGVSYWVVGPLAGLVGVLARQVVAYYFS